MILNFVRPEHTTRYGFCIERTEIDTYFLFFLCIDINQRNMNTTIFTLRC